MQPAGLLVMAVSVGAVTALFLWCVWLVLTRPSGEVEELPDDHRRS
ncbi:MAG: hypothetical protein ACKOES_07040 [Planctomycetaceae bacterium]